MENNNFYRFGLNIKLKQTNVHKWIIVISNRGSATEHVFDKPKPLFISCLC